MRQPILSPSSTGRALLLLLGAVGFAFSLPGCHCGPPNSKPLPALTFVFPTDGATLHSTDNQNPSAPAGTIQIDVSLTVVNASSGSPVTLTVDGSPGGSATVGQGGKVTVPLVSLTGSAGGASHALKASVTDSGGAGSASATANVTVVLPAGTCSVSVAPPDGTIFNETGALVSGNPTVKDLDLTTPGMQARIVATVGSSCADGSSASLLTGSQVLATTTVSSGQAIFDQVTLPDTPVTALTQRTQRLQISVSVGTAGGPGGSGSSLPVGYILDSQTPTASIAQPANGVALTDSQDVDPAVPGLQIMVIGQTKGFAAQIAAGIPVGFSIVNAQGTAYPTPKGVSPLAADGSFSVEITLANGSDSLAFQATTATGNLAQSSAVVVTASSTPTVQITRPNAGTILNVFYDTDTNSPGLQTEVDFATTAQPGSPITLCSTVSPGVGSPGACPVPGGGFVVGKAGAAGGLTILTGVTLGEGDQLLVAQVQDSGGTALSATVAVSVHTTRPTVTSIAFSNVFVDSDGGLWLNADGGGTTVATVDLEAGDLFAQPDGGSPSTIGLVDLNSLQTLASGTVTLDGGVAQAQFPLTFSDGTYPLEARVTDLWGNPNYLPNFNPPLTSPATTDVTLSVKTTLPSCAFTGPVGPYWNVQDNGGVVTSDPVTLPVTLVTASASANVNGTILPGELSLSVNGQGSSPVPVSRSAVVDQLTAPQGPDVFTGLVADPAGNLPQACRPAGGLALTVATVPPTIAIGDPKTFSPKPDSVSDGGVPEYTTTRAFAVDVTTDAAQGQQITLLANGSPVATAAVVAGGTTSIQIAGLDNGVVELVAKVSDVAGNVATSQPVQVAIDARGCGLRFASPSSNPILFNGEGAVDGGSGPVQDGGLLAEIVLSSDCTGTPVQFTNTPQGGSPETVSTTSDPTSGDAIFYLSLADGASGTLSAQITYGGVTTNIGPVAYDTKLSSPTLAAAVPNAAALWIVAPGANPNIGTTSDGGFLYVASTSNYDPTNNPFATATFSANVANLGPAVQGSSGLGTASLQLSFPGQTTTNPTSQVLTTDPETVTFQGVDLPPNATSGTVTLTVADNAGNLAVQSWSVQTGVIPPGAPTVTATVTDERRATVHLSWSAPADDLGNAVAGYDLRWTTQGWTNPIDDAQFFAGPVAGVNSDPGIAAIAGAAPGTNQTYDLTALPPFNTWSIALRSIDQAGNRSEPIPVVTVHDNVIAGNPNQSWNQATITGPSNVYFGLQLRSADFNGDGKTDLAITAPVLGSAAGSVYIVNGNANPALMTFANATQLTTSAPGDTFGYDLEVGDFTGTGFPGLAIGSPGWNGHEGRVDLYANLGAGFTASSPPSIEIQGTPTSVQTTWFGFTVKSIGDIDGDGHPDLFIGAPFDGQTKGFAAGSGYIFYSSTLKAAVAAGTNSCPASSSSAACLTYAQADITFQGLASPQENLGARWAAAGLGNGFFILPATGDSKVYGFQVSAMKGLASPVSASASAFSLTDGEGPNSGTTPGFFNSFGDVAIAGQSFTAGSTPDLVISDSVKDNVYLYTTTKGGVTQTPVATMNQHGSFGWALASVDVNLDGKPDLIIGTNDYATSSAMIYLNSGGAPFFTVAPSAVLTNVPETLFGIGVSAGSYQGGLLPDVAVSATGNSTVTLYY